MAELINSVAASWWQWMSAMTWQVGLLFLVVWLLDVAFRDKMWPQVRYALWLLVFIKLVFPPAFALPVGLLQGVQPAAESLCSYLLVAEREPSLPVGEEPVTDESEGAGAEGGVEGRAESTEDVQDSAAGGRGAESLGWQAWLFCFWLAGASVFAALLWSDTRKLRRWHAEQLKRKAIPEWYSEILIGAAKKLRIEKLPAIVFSDRIHTPAVFGFFKPVLLLPRSFADDLTHDELRHMTLHELTHLKRKDLLLNGILLLLQVLYWFNPLVLLAMGKIKHAREVCCDLTVADSLKEKVAEYRKTLVNATRRLLTESVAPGMGLLGVFEEPYMLLNRLKWLEKDMSVPSTLVKLSSLILVAFFMLFLFPMSPFSDHGMAMGAFAQLTFGGGPGAQEGSFLYVKDETTRRTYRAGEIVSEDPTSTEESWQNDNTAVIIEGGKRLIVDVEAGTYTLVNDATRTYIQAPIPLDVNSLYDEETRAVFGSRVLYGLVEETGRTETILGYDCREFRFTRWQERDGRRFNESAITIMVASDLPVSTKAFDVALDNRRKLTGGSEQIRQELAKLSGTQMRIDFNPEVDRDGVKLISETKAIEVREAPRELFEIPADYVRKSSFSRQDF